MATRRKRGTKGGALNINADLGEGVGSDDEILQWIDSANICCGTYAGSATITIETANRCRSLSIQIGAHPGYDDRENYGRIEANLSPREIEDLVRFQVGGLRAVSPLAYIKCHGMLYTRCQDDIEAARAVARVAADYGVGLLGQPGFHILLAAAELGVPAYREGYADRAYQSNGKLVPRTMSGAVLSPAAAAEQGVRLAKSGSYDTICLHGDSPGAPEVARTLRYALTAAGVSTEPLGAHRKA